MDEEEERRYVIDEQVTDDGPGSDRNYVSKVGGLLSDVGEWVKDAQEYMVKAEEQLSERMGLPEGVPLYQMRADLVEKQDMTYDEEKDAIIYTLSEDSTTVQSLEISSREYLRHMSATDRREMNSYERTERTKDEQSLMVATAIANALEDYNTDHVIIRTDHGWERDIETGSQAETLNEAYSDAEHYIRTYDKRKQ